MTPKDAVKFAKEKNARMVDFKFLDFVGVWQHFSVPTIELSEDIFDEGLGFDGSSIRGWQPIHASDMLVVPDPTTAMMDPFTETPTMSLICNIVDPITKEAYSRDPRNIAGKAEAYLKSTGIGDVAYFGPEPEFFILDDVRYSQGADHGFYYIDSVEGIWNTGRDEGPNLGYKPRHKEGYFPCPPTDSQEDIRTEMCLVMEQVGIHVERQHHEVATAGQAEIDMRFDSLLKMGDKLMWFKLVPGYEAPINLAYSSRNRSASIRIPMYSPSPKSKRIEVRFPDPSCNGYLAFAAMLMAGLDGIQNKIHPGEPLDKDIYGLSPEELKTIPSAAVSLEEALEALKADHAFLLKGDVFTQDVIDTWIEYKMDKEVNQVRLRPVPHEFNLYFDC